MSQKPITVYLRDGIFVPTKFVDEEKMAAIQSRLEYHTYKNEKTCEKCEYFEDRYSDLCRECPNYGGLVTLYKVDDLELPSGKLRRCVKIPYGDRAGIKKIFGKDLNIKDLTPEIPIKPFKMKNELYKPQKLAIKDMMEVRSGVLKSPPRSGKTVMGAAYVAKKQLKTIIIGAQQDWLDNFMETFVGSDTQEAMTNIKKSRVCFAKKLEDFKKHDICLVTYQTFLSEKGQKLLKKISSMFSILIVDEVQGSAAPAYCRIVSQFNARYKFGLSGTPERKDAQEKIIYKIFGKIFHESKVERLRPRIEVVDPPPLPTLPKTWQYMVAKLEGNPQRLKQIIDIVLKDVKAGHTVFIPLASVDVIKALTQAINRVADRKIAQTFYGGMKKSEKKKTIDLARKRKIKVLVGNTRMLSTGINVPCASMLYQLTPSSNLPKADQRFSRVLTPHEGKPQPVVKYWLDKVDVVRSCLRNEHFQCMVPTFKPLIDQRTRVILDRYFATKKKRDHDDLSTGGFI